jgi:hypothetical protein
MSISLLLSPFVLLLSTFMLNLRVSVISSHQIGDILFSTNDDFQVIYSPQPNSSSSNLSITSDILTCRPTLPRPHHPDLRFNNGASKLILHNDNPLKYPQILSFSTVGDAFFVDGRIRISVAILAVLDSGCDVLLFHATMCFLWSYC